MEELAATVKRNADNAAHADQIAHSATERAEIGGAEVARLVETMSEISRDAGRIVDIISVIDGIAFQTNILALNAAVEAARAGEQGRGFAVVASEVRALAHRSAEAAKEIKSLIGSSVGRVEAGTRQVEKAGAAIGTLVADVKQVGDLMRSIAEASAEQSRGVSQVNRTITDMDRVVQQNAALVEESATAAESMRAQAEMLIEAVSRFELGEPAKAAEEPTDPAPIAPSVPQAQPRDSKHSLALALGRTPVALGDEWQEL
jgi:methyl-accepting chemotaxis protein